MMSLVYASLNPRLSMADLEKIAKRSTDAKVRCLEIAAKAIEATPPEYRDQVIAQTMPMLIQLLCML